jgi:hypothetical protein
VLSGPVRADAPPRRKRDYVTLIEASYDLTSDDGTWLLGIVRLDRGFGVAGHFWDISEKVQSGFGIRPTSGGRPSFTRRTRNPGRSSRLPRPKPCSWKATPAIIGPRNRDEYDRPHAAYRSKMNTDCFIHVSCADVTRMGCSITAPRIGDTASPALGRALAQVSRHVVAGMRLRRALQGAREPEGRNRSTDAVLDTKGRLLHVESHASGRREREGLIHPVRACSIATRPALTTRTGGRALARARPRSVVVDRSPGQRR